MFRMQPPIPPTVRVQLRHWRPLAIIFVGLIIGWIVLAAYWPKTVLYYVAASAGILTSISLGLHYHGRIKRGLEDLEAEERERQRELQVELEGMPTCPPSCENAKADSESSTQTRDGS